MLTAGGRTYDRFPVHRCERSLRWLHEPGADHLGAPSCTLLPSRPDIVRALSCKEKQMDDMASVLDQMSAVGPIAKAAMGTKPTPKPELGEEDDTPDDGGGP